MVCFLYHFNVNPDGVLHKKQVLVNIKFVESGVNLSNDAWSRLDLPDTYISTPGFLCVLAFSRPTNPDGRDGLDHPEDLVTTNH